MRPSPAASGGSCATGSPPVGVALAPADRDLLGRATWLLGDVPGSMEHAEQAFAGYVAQGRDVTAAELALRLSIQWATRGDAALAGAWFARARRLLEDVPACAATGYLRYTAVLLAPQIDGDARSTARLRPAPSPGQWHGDRSAQGASDPGHRRHWCWPRRGV